MTIGERGKALQYGDVVYISYILLIFIVFYIFISILFVHKNLWDDFGDFQIFAAFQRALSILGWISVAKTLNIDGFMYVWLANTQLSVPEVHF